MDINIACDILDINKNYSQEELKKKYRLYALKFHPDKNKDPGAEDKFKEINSAYVYLSENIHNQKDTLNGENYKTLFESFLKSLLVGESIPSDIIQLITNIVSDYKKTSIHLFEKLNKKQITYVYEFINQYKYIFHIDEDFIKQIYNMIQKKYVDDNLIIINTTLNDLINNNIYVLNIQENTYYIPLWHNELYYELEDKKELIVKCIPELEKNIFIDHLNDIYIDIRFKIDGLLEKKNIEYTFGNNILYIPVQELCIKKKQLYILKNQGIPIIDLYDIYNVDNKSNIIFTIELY
jgi:hypothetical protein